MLYLISPLIFKKQTKRSVSFPPPKKKKKSFFYLESHFLLNKHNPRLFKENKNPNFQRILYYDTILIIDNFKLIEIIQFIYLVFFLEKFI